MTRIVDIAHVIDDDGTYDYTVDANGDLATSGGLTSPIVVSLFTDRRAFDDEVADPLRRRGWLGATLLPSGRFGSGLWFYEQARLNQETVVGVRAEIEAGLEWMVTAGLIDNVTAFVEPDPERRQLDIRIELQLPPADRMRRASEIAEATEAGILAGIPTSPQQVYFAPVSQTTPFGMLLIIMKDP